MPSSSTFSSASFSTFTSTSSSSGQQQPPPPTTQHQTYTERAVFNDRDGGRVERTATATGQPPWRETARLDPQGRRVLPSAGARSDGDAARRRIEDVTDDDAPGDAE